MSSATSINRLRREQRANASSVQKDAFKPWHFFVLLSLLAATAAVLATEQRAPEQLVLLSAIVAGAGLCGAALYVTLLPFVRREEEGARPPLSERTRAALEREKMLVLRSIKELEFDRAMGKTSSADFDELAARLRARALTLMRQLDAGMPAYRTTIEQELAARLQKTPVAPAPIACGCGTPNDSDASFCKRCGKRLQPERGAKPPSESERGWGPASADKR